MLPLAKLNPTSVGWLRSPVYFVVTVESWSSESHGVTLNWRYRRSLRAIEMAMTSACPTCDARVHGVVTRGSESAGRQ